MKETTASLLFIFKRKFKIHAHTEINSPLDTQETSNSVCLGLLAACPHLVSNHTAEKL